MRVSSGWGEVLLRVTRYCLVVWAPLLLADQSLPGSTLLDVSEPGPGLSAVQLAQSSLAPDNAPAVLAAPRFDIRSYRLDGNTLLKASDIAEAVAPYTGKSKDFGDVQHALEAVQALYQKRNYAGVQVTLPEQELERGEVMFRVVEPRVTRILVEGNEHFKLDNIRRTVPGLRLQEPPNSKRIASGIRLANENPAKQSAVLLRPGAKEGDVDAVIRVADVHPVRYSVSIDNTGTKETGFQRVGFAYQHANLFDRDHVLTTQFITSPANPNDVQVLGLGYRIPFYSLGDSIDLIAGYSSVDSGTVENLFTVAGQGAIYAMRYNHNLTRWGDLEHKLVYGIDYRSYQNSVIILNGGLVNLVPDITVHPFSVTYHGQIRQQSSEWGFYLGYAQNIKGGNDGTDDIIKSSRRNGRTTYRIWRLGASYARQVFGDWQMRIKLDGQFTRDALISPEQFGMGGADGVRGFNERYGTNDRGHRANFEIFTPDVSKKFGSDNSQLRLLAFYDTGAVGRNSVLPSELKAASVDSFGFGLRMNYGKNASFKADYAQVIHDGTESGTRAGRTHANRFHVTFAYVF